MGMPSAGPSGPNGPTKDRKNVVSNRKTSSAKTAGFTFVDQSTDIRSLADKKIVNSDQRHTIRSHVMQKVRKDEKLQGKKRPAGRDNSRKTSKSVVAASTTSPSLNGLSDSSTSPINQSERSNEEQKALVQVGGIQEVITDVPRSPSLGRLDPFNTLPGGLEIAKVVDQLMIYCFHTFIPVTFPIDSSTPREYTKWRLKILASQSANTATFFGMMAIVAAHQGISNKRHKDLRPTITGERPTDLLIDKDFVMMKSRALKATQARIAQNGWDGPTVEAIFSLIGAEHMLGNFEEAKTHLSALRKLFLTQNSTDSKSPVSDWIPLTDVKGAIGTMERPLFRLPWDVEPIPQETLDKLHNWQTPESANLGTAFNFIHEISSPMQAILRQASLICRFGQFTATHGSEIAAKESELFRHKTLELEYDVLSYVYPGSPSDNDQLPQDVNHIEQLARLAVLGIVSCVLTKVMPSLGIGRALTHHQNQASQAYYSSIRTPPSKATAQFILWSQIIFAQCALGQPEERYFINSIAWYSQWAGVHDWISFEVVCNSFLYIPSYQRVIWQEIWRKACQFQQVSFVPQKAVHQPYRSRITLQS